MEAAMKLMMTLTLMLTLSVTANAADSAGYGLSVLVDAAIELIEAEARANN
jgi:hypothetical protein